LQALFSSSPSPCDHSISSSPSPCDHSTNHLGASDPPPAPPPLNPSLFF
jgi:hypothetical protein